MGSPLFLVLGGAGLLALVASRSRSGGEPTSAPEARSETALSCEEARQLCVDAIEQFVRAETGVERETASSWVAKYKRAVSESCAIDELTVQSPSCRAAASALTAFLSVDAGGDEGDEERTRLFTALYRECPYLTAEGVFYVVLRLPHVTRGLLVRDTPEGVQPTLDELTEANVAFLREHPDTPSLYASGVRYGIETMGLDDWNAIPFVLAQGIGDCEDLACWLAAEYRVRGVQAEPFATSMPLGSLDANLLHVQVRLPDGRVEDPSARLGMRSILPSFGDS